MKIFIRPRKSILLYVPIVFLFLFAFSLVSYSQTFVGATTVPAADGGAQLGPTVTIAPPGGTAANDLVIIYAEYRGAVIPTMLQTGGQTWNTATTYAPGGTNQAIAIYWCTFNGTCTQSFRNC